MIILFIIMFVLMIISIGIVINIFKGFCLIKGMLLNAVIFCLPLQGKDYINIRQMRFHFRVE